MVLFACQIKKYGQGDGVVGGKNRANSKREFKSPCVVLFSERDYADRRQEEQPIECELRGEDINGKQYKLVRIKDLKTSWAQRNKIISGSTTLFADDSFIDETTNELVIPAGAALEVNIISMVL
jgi:hypothetical protein